MKEQEVRKKLEKGDGQAWKENRIVYVDGKIYIPNSQKRYFKKTMNQWT